MQVSKWGNSLAIRLPASVVRALSLEEGDEVVIRLAGEREMEVARRPGRAALLARLDRFQGRLPPDFVVDRDAAHER